MSKIIEHQLAAYRPNFLIYGNTPQGTFQNNTVTQYERFNQLLYPLLQFKAEAFSICDIGAGVCDLHQYLENNGVKHQYTGIEIVPEMVETAQKLYPQIEVLNIDFLSEDFHRKFDFVVLSGTFNLPNGVNKEEWESFVFSMIEKMFYSSKLGISFNALTSYSTFYDESLFYLEPEKVLSFIQKKLSRFCSINTAYPLFEVSYSIYTPECIKNHFRKDEFKKYLK
jgi:hypothetical protein